ncbi:uncharacterized protein LAESUDRAFT_763548 [Laetiporus sulphureus 93-53]|uniref:F-box domain-containing protein n=1 Tax=Laetiporus sulphureus 93-53 TaxID=1314785 RepID=A0A165BUL0_9APHY|nr:uncharacterized protein LAESUDRAFT_763548 [Laetiporus sulphureus 93-53]KZT01684.1 hypothetical protein LAESUDRAFT_763548 [Laetiporus sulphureus 93-53]
MSRQKRGTKTPSLEGLRVSDLIRMRSSKLDQRDTRQRARELRHLEGLIKAAEVQAERCDSNAHVAINRLPPEVLREIFVTTCTVKLNEYISKYYGGEGFTTIWDPI